MSSSSNPSPPQRLRRTKWGRYAAHITREDVEACFHLPSAQACVELGVGLTILKRICRGFGIDRWPYRNKLADSAEGAETSPAQGKTSRRKRRAAQQQRHVDQRSEVEEEGEAEKGCSSGRDTLAPPEAEPVEVAPREEYSEQEEGSSSPGKACTSRQKLQQCRRERHMRPYSLAHHQRQKLEEQGQLPGEVQIKAEDEQLPASNAVATADVVDAGAAAGSQEEVGEEQLGPSRPFISLCASTRSGGDTGNTSESSNDNESKASEQEGTQPGPEAREGVALASMGAVLEPVAAAPDWTETSVKCEAGAAAAGMTEGASCVLGAALLDGDLFLQGVRDAAFLHARRSMSLPEPASLPFQQACNGWGQVTSTSSCPALMPALCGLSSMPGHAPALPPQPKRQRQRAHHYKGISIDPPRTLASPFSLNAGDSLLGEALVRPATREASTPLWRRNSAPGGQATEMANMLLPWADTDLANPWTTVPAVPELPLLGTPTRLDSMVAAELLPSLDRQVLSLEGSGSRAGLMGTGQGLVPQDRAVGLGLEAGASGPLASMLLLDGGLDGLQSSLEVLGDPYLGLL